MSLNSPSLAQRLKVQSPETVGRYRREVDDVESMKPANKMITPRVSVTENALIAPSNEFKRPLAPETNVPSVKSARPAIRREAPGTV